MNPSAQHSFTPGQAVIWYNPKNDRRGVVIQKGDELKVKTSLANGKEQVWPLVSDGMVLWKEAGHVVIAGSQTFIGQDRIKAMKKKADKKQKVFDSFDFELYAADLKPREIKLSIDEWKAFEENENNNRHRENIITLLQLTGEHNLAKWAKKQPYEVLAKYFVGKLKVKAPKEDDGDIDLMNMVFGFNETISSPTRQYDIKYVLVPQQYVITSHDEQTFAKNPEYPGICQERNYHSDKTEQFKVVNNAQKFDPRFVILKSPTASDGAPVAVLHKGKFIVMGGNSRAMIIKRTMAFNPTYTNYLKANCEQFGFKAEDVKPDHILIRAIRGKFDIVVDCSRVSRDLNESFTQAKDQNAEAASIARSISTSTIDSLSAALDNYDSLAEFYTSSHAAHFVNDLRSDGIITSQNANKWLLPNGALNDTAKDLITKMLVARIVTDKDQLAMLSKSLLNKIAYVIPQLIKLQSTEWDLTADIQKIVELDIKRAGMDINAYLKQDDMFGDKVSLTRCQYTIALAFAEYGVRKLKEKMSQFLESARSNEGESLFDKVTRPEAIETLFGKELKTTRIEMKHENPTSKRKKIKNPAKLLFPWEVSEKIQNPEFQIIGKADAVLNMILEKFKDPAALPGPLAQVFVKNENSHASRLSLMNQFIIALFGESDAMGFKAWQEFGRNVKKGGHGIPILAPILKTFEKDAVNLETGEKEKEKISLIKGFKHVTVFGLSQTEGKPYEIHEDRQFIDDLPFVDVAKSWGLKLTTYSGADAKALGTYRPQTSIALGTKNPSTFAHELIHAADDRLGELKLEKYRLSDSYRRDAEIVAEIGGATLLYAVGMENEADLGGAYEYASRYAQDKDPRMSIYRVLDRTMRAVQLVINTALELKANSKYEAAAAIENPINREDTVWDKNNIAELLEVIGQENYKFKKGETGVSHGDFGKVIFTVVGQRTLYLEFETESDAKIALASLSRSLTNPYEFSTRTDVMPKTIMVQFTDNTIENPLFGSRIKPGMAFFEAETGRGVKISEANDTTAFITYSDGKTGMYGIEAVENKIRKGIWTNKVKNPVSKQQDVKNAITRVIKKRTLRGASKQEINDHIDHLKDVWKSNPDMIKFLENIKHKTENPVIGNALIKYVLVFAPYREEDWLTQEETPEAAFKFIRSPKDRVEKWTFADNGSGKLIKREVIRQRPSSGQSPSKAKIANPKKNPGATTIIMIGALAKKLWKSKRFEKYTDAVKEASRQIMAGKKKRFRAKVDRVTGLFKTKNPSVGVTNAQMDAFGKDSPESVNIPTEKGLALLAKASVMELHGPDGKQSLNFRGSDLYSTADGKWLVIAPSRHIINKRVKVSDEAKQMYERFNHYEFDKSHALRIPLDKQLVPVGKITAIEYDSDKMIYKSDQRTGPKERAYVHAFDAPADVFKPKGDKGKFFIIGPMKKAVTERGIEA